MTDQILVTLIGGAQIILRLPDGAGLPVAASGPVVSSGPEEPPHPGDVAPASMVFQGEVPIWPPGFCPKHPTDWEGQPKPWTRGNRGLYCTAKDEVGPKGYCVIKPGDIWNGKRAVA